MCSQCEGTKERSKAYLAYREGVKDGRESPTLPSVEAWIAFDRSAAERYGEHAQAYRRGFDEGYNS